MTIKQVKIETKLEIIDYKSPNKFDQILTDRMVNYNSKLSSFNLSLFSEPSNYNSAAIELDKFNLNFINIFNNNKINFVQIYSNDLFYLKFTECFILHTKNFSFFNDKIALSDLFIANGTLKLEDDNLINLNSSKNITVNYFLAYFSNTQDLNLTWNTNNAGY